MLIRAIASLEELQQTYLTVDFPEDVKVPSEPNQMVTASVVGSSIRFSYCGLGRAIAYLREQYAVGLLEVKVVDSLR